jgi:dihydroceramide fatty acyl 2-hydroxylase
MNKNTVVKQYGQATCFLIFALFLAPLILSAELLQKMHPLYFHVLLFGAGWFTWTFFEYVLHRFWTHGSHISKDTLVVQRHQHHHTHPTDIKVTGMQRVIMIAISFSLIAASIYFNNYFTFFAGICVGINWFFLIHYFLHQTWAKKVFPRLLNFHIVHHCKYPSRCFCFSLTLWDDLFNTGIPPGTVISHRIIDFYFGEEHHH